MNEFELSSVRKNRTTEEKKVTTKELSEILNVDVKTIQRAVDSLDMNVERIGSSHTMVFTESQATAIKIELQNHSKVSRNGFNTMSINNDLEMMLVQKKLTEYQNIRIEQLQAQIENLAPKAEIAETLIESDSLQDLQTVAVTIGLKNIFKVLSADKILEKKKSEDGRDYYKPYAEYSQYFEVKNKPWIDDYGKSHSRPRVFVNTRGLAWLARRYGTK